LLCVVVRISLLIVTEAPDDASIALQRAARQALRQRLLAERELFAASPAAAAATQALATALCRVVADLEPSCLGLYCSLRSEFNAAQAIAADPRCVDLSLALPYARREGRSMEFRAWDGLPPTRADECGIGSSDGALIVPDVIIVPCVGFTAHGHRLGYGGGYYDRWLAAHPQVTAVGVAWSFTAITEGDFAARGHDIPLAFVVTERGIS
jgi:5-formyltetrahydrofolate cyclo-ligase